MYYKRVMETYKSEKEYLTALKARSELPRGFLSSTGEITFFPGEKPSAEPYRMNLSLIVLEESTPLFGGMYTRNAFPGAPVILGRRRLDNPFFRGVLINNKISNVGAPRGLADAERLTDRLGELLGTSGEEFLSSSTGIIGWSLPAPEMLSALDDLASGLKKNSLLPVARAIMTTDSFPKLREASLESGRIVAVGKGAGMIEPNLSTMLVYILTDFSLDRSVLRRSLEQAVEASFNRITIDGDQSTSDTVLLISSGRGPRISEESFTDALTGVCRKIAEDIVRNGEGTHHVMRISVEGPFDGETLLGTAKGIANSSLVKTAVFGNDPNVGRILMALGDYLGNRNISVDPSLVTVVIGDTEVYGDGAFRLDVRKEKELVQYLTGCQLDSSSGFPEHDRTVDIVVRLGEGSGSAEVLASDFSYDYVKANADYRT